MAPPNTTNSQSGLIRKRMGPRIATLKRLLAEAKKRQKAKSEDNEQAKIDLAESVEEIIAKLETTSEKTEMDNQEWLTLIGSLIDDEKQAEEEIYSSWATDEEDDKRFIFLLDEANTLTKMLQSKLNRLRPIIQAESGNTDLNTSNTSGQTTNRNHRAPKLKNLELPCFSGDPLAFKEFWVLFAAAVDSADFDAITKFSYLRQQLRGTARDAVAGLEVSEENYALAIQLLRDRFEKTTPEIIGTLYSKLKMMPRSTVHHESLRKTYDAIEKIVRQLKNVGVEMDSNQLLVMDILSKFPEQVIREITMRKTVDIRSTVEETERAIEEYIQQEELLSGMVNDLKPFSGSAQYNQQQRNKMERMPYKVERMPYRVERTSYQSRLNTGNEGNSDNSAFTTVENIWTPKRECVFCGEAHFHSECPNFTTRKARQQRISENNYCERCLCYGHAKEACRTRKFKIKCYICKAIGSHSSPFCSTIWSNKPKEVACAAHDKKMKKPKSQEKNKNDKFAGNTVNALSIDETALLSTALATISNPETGKKQQVRVIFDNCSHRSYIKQSVVTELQLPQEKTGPLKVSVFGSSKSISVDTKLVTVCVHLKEGNTINMTVNSTPLITSCSVIPTNLPENTRKLLSTMKSVLADDLEVAHGAPELLIGADLFWDFLAGSPLKTADGIYLIPTTLGMVLGGCYKSANTRANENVMLCLTERATIPGIETALSTVSLETRAKLPPDLHDFWSLETIGITDDPIIKDDEAVLENFEKTIQYTNGRYEVEWPWRDISNELPSNYNLALGRLKSLVKRFRENENTTLPEKYSTIFSEQMEKQIIEKVPQEEVRSNNITHYLAHHAVIKDSHMTTKVRIVFDGSAKCGKSKPSLNECLMRGPVILPNLCAILIRFQLNPVAIISDVEKAFHQIGLKKSQRDAVRFLWLKDPAKLTTENNVQIYRFQRVPFGTISSPFLLGATLMHHLQAKSTPIAKKIAANLYVDNCITGTQDEDAAVQFHEEAKTIFRSAGMNLREFCSNSEKFCQHIPAEYKCSSRTVKVLGMKWNSVTDRIKLEPSWKNDVNGPTKRGILKSTASIFDPLGYFQPVTIKLKCFIRDLWNTKRDWDDPLPDELINCWRALQTEVAPIFDVEVRRFSNSITDEATIIVFTDASADAYAAAAYLRTKSGTTWQTHLVVAKSRVTPKSTWKKDVTIPRLELLGVTIGSRLSKFVRQAVMAPYMLPVHLFCDSTCVLNWVKSTKVLDRFTSNRVKQIRKVENATFHFVKSELNPADMATRGISGEELKNNDLWWHGPPFLQDDLAQWPTKEDTPKITSDELQKIDETMKQSNIFGPGTFLAGEGSSETGNWTPLGIDATRSSNLHKLLRITVVCLKFVKQTLWNRAPNSKVHHNTVLNDIFAKVSDENSIRANELSEALQLWVKSCQSTEFSDLRKAIADNQPHRLKREFNVDINEGILRCYGRVRNADIPEETINPVLLPKKSYVTRLIIDDAHRKVMHAGVRHTLSQLRRKYWVPQGRQAVRGAISQCRVCKRFRGHGYVLPKMPPLPRERVARAKPFEYTGLDFIGPINVRVNDEVKKSWICLYTCLTVRAVHLEWMIDCTAVAFINCTSRFIARRGTPTKIISDNAAQFHLANDLFKRTWKKVLVDEEVISYASAKGIEWTFTTELAPWQGGVYERLVGVVKHTMRTQIGRKLLQLDNFVTLLSEVEAVVNSRPITYVYSGLSSGQPLRPMDFLQELPAGTPTVDPSLKPEGGNATKHLLQHWKNKQRKLDQYWNLWYTEYLLSLRQRDDRQHRNNRNAVKLEPKVGEIVLVENEDAPRGNWKLARITQLLRGRDDVVRSAELLLPNRQLIRRPTNHLYSLEIPSFQDFNRRTDETNSNSEEDFEGFEAEEVEAAAELGKKYGDNQATLSIISTETEEILLNGLQIDAVRVAQDEL